MRLTNHFTYVTPEELVPPARVIPRTPPSPIVFSSPGYGLGPMSTKPLQQPIPGVPAHVVTLPSVVETVVSTTDGRVTTVGTGPPLVVSVPVPPVVAPITAADASVGLTTSLPTERIIDTWPNLRSALNSLSGGAGQSLMAVFPRLSVAQAATDAPFRQQEARIAAKDAELATWREEYHSLASYPASKRTRRTSSADGDLD